MKRGKPALMHGDGSYIRSWLHAEDTVAALFTIISKGEVNSIYNVSGNVQLRNIEVLRKLARILNVPEDRAWIQVGDRSGQDLCYSIDDQRIRQLGWGPQRDFDESLEEISNETDFHRFL